MNEIDYYKKELADLFLILLKEDSKVVNNDVIFYNGMKLCNIETGESYDDLLDRLTMQEMIDIANRFKYRSAYETTGKRMRDVLMTANKLYAFNDYYSLDNKIKEIDNSLQNTIDIVNLFTDVDINRSNLDEQNKETSKRLLNIKKQHSNINNRLEKLETSISQLFNMLQKVDF